MFFRQCSFPHNIPLSITKRSFVELNEGDLIDWRCQVKMINNRCICESMPVDGVLFSYFLNPTPHYLHKIELSKPSIIRGEYCILFEQLSAGRLRCSVSWATFTTAVSRWIGCFSFNCTFFDVSVSAAAFLHLVLQVKNEQRRNNTIHLVMKSALGLFFSGIFHTTFSPLFFSLFLFSPGFSPLALFSSGFYYPVLSTLGIFPSNFFHTQLFPFFSLGLFPLSIF